MTILKVIPINMITTPNFWSATKDSFWVVTAATAIDLWGQITVVDALGPRPYVPANGSVLQAVFQRGDYIGNINNQNLTVTKTCILDSNFRAMAKISLTADEATNIISGTIVFTLTEGTLVNKWTQNWSCKKLNTSAGF